MRKPNPLSEILESSMLRDEPMLDTEWPAGEVLLQDLQESPTPQRSNRGTSRLAAPLMRR